MAEDSKKGSVLSLSNTGMLALALAVIGLIWSGPSPFITERPNTRMTSGSYKGKVQDVDARMWQDPLGAIRKDAQKPPSRQRSVLLKQGSKNELKLVIEEEIAGESDHSPKNTILREFTEKSLKKVMMLAVMLPGGPYPEAEEGRRRKRYAVLSALATLDFAPKETELIGYFRTGSGDRQLPDAIPFEVFEKWQHAEKRKVIVLWLDDSSFDRDIRRNINEVFNLAKPVSTGVDIRQVVIGPNKSDHLRRLIREADPNEKSGGETEFFAAEATVSPFWLDYGYKGTDAQKKYSPIEDLWRTIGNDGDISSALVEELRLRQIKSETDRVLLISEWDSLYGRSFPRTFAKAYAEKTTGESADIADCLPVGDTKPGNARVYCVNYMRGIDGLVPGDTGKPDVTQDAAGKPEAIQINNNIDRPSGNHQKDYLRRLVDQVRKLDANLRNTTLPCPVRNNGITAIGVVGSDVFDKLMILQALRPYFPGKIFFTTDLDAAYFSPQEQPYTHNLIVGSSFGLSLAPELQMSIPPFRDSYQTAIFFSTKVATMKWNADENRDAEKLHEKDIATHMRDWLDAPRVFEIGRKGPVDLSPANPVCEGDASCLPEMCKKDIRNCNHIHPDPDIGYHAKTSVSVVVLELISLVLGLLLLYRVSWTFRWLPEKIRSWVDRLQDCVPQSDGQEAASGTRVWIARAIELTSMLPLVAMGTLVVGAIYLALITIGKDEPFYWGNGVSIWPSILLTSLSIVFSAAFYYRGRKKLEECDRKLGLDFALNGMEAQSDRRRFLTVHAWKQSSNDSSIDVKGLWRDYVKYGERSARFWRAALNTLIFVAFGLTAIMLTGGLPVPARGNGFYLDVIIEIVCTIAAVFLIMWIVDAARLFSRLISLLAEDKKSDWPNVSDKKWGWPAKYADYSAYWMDIQFVAQYTKAMEKFIWYPIPSLLLIGAARSQVLDNWTFSPGLLAAIAILLLYLFSIAFLLQYGAKEMRAKAAGKLCAQLRGLRCQPEIDEREISQLEKMIGEIRNNEEGAFTPFMQQPMVQALLAFLSGSGGLLLLLDNFF